MHVHIFVHLVQTYADLAVDHVHHNALLGVVLQVELLVVIQHVYKLVGKHVLKNVSIHAYLPVAAVRICAIRVLDSVLVNALLGVNTHVHYVLTYVGCGVIQHVIVTASLIVALFVSVPALVNV
jgi:hypothetical protein